MKKNRNFRFFLALVGIVFLFGLNEILVGTFEVMVQNTGVSFGLNIGGILLSGIMLVILGWWVIGKENDGPLLLIWWGGGLNLIEKMRFGFVRDYWYLGFGLYNNLADWIIALGVAMFIINLWTKKSR